MDRDEDRACRDQFPDVTLAQPQCEGGWLKKTTEPTCYLDLVQMQTFEKADGGGGIGFGISVPLG